MRESQSIAAAGNETRGRLPVFFGLVMNHFEHGPAKPLQLLTLVEPDQFG